MNNKVCYTCIYRSTDKLKEIQYKSEGWDYVCLSFIDEEITSDTWKIDRINRSNSELFKSLYIDKIVAAFKISPNVVFPNYEYSLYIDSSIQIKHNLNLIYEMYCGSSITVLLHPTGNCIYTEFLKAIENSSDDTSILERQIKKFRNEGFPLNYGLYDTRIIGRHHNEADVVRVMNDWVIIMNDYSHIDYLSLPYALWKNGKRDKLSIFPTNLFMTYNEQ